LLLWSSNLVIVGVHLWLVDNCIPMDGKVKQLINVVGVVARF
jgi:hypothetical protein